MAHLLTSMILVLGVIALLMGLFSNFSTDGMATSLLMLGLGFLLLLFVLGGLCPPVRESGVRKPRSASQRGWQWVCSLPKQRWAALALAALVVPASYLVFYTPVASDARGPGVSAAPQPAAQPLPSQRAPSAWEARAPATQEPALSLKTSARLSATPNTPRSFSEPDAAAAAPEQGSSPSSTDSHLESVMSDAVETWRAAWASKDVDRYLGAYAPSFVSEDGLDITRWKAFRRERLARAQTIAIQIESLSVIPQEEGKVMFTQFVQHYHAGPVKDSVQKTLHWRQLEQGWRIVREETRPL